MGIKPEDILPNGDDHTSLNGQLVRKGTIAAFLANIDILENSSSTENEKKAAISVMRDLAKSVIAIGLHKHASLKNSEAEKILIEAAEAFKK